MQTDLCSSQFFTTLILLASILIFFDNTTYPKSKSHFDKNDISLNWQNKNALRVCADPNVQLQREVAWDFLYRLKYYLGIQQQKNKLFS